MLSCAFFLAYVFRTARTISAAERNQLSQWMAAAWVFGLGGVALAQGIAIATAPEPVDAAIYVAGTLVLLALAGLQVALHAFNAITERG